ncbi:NB-ARC domain-containing protein, partial [Nocardia amamiensis]|uniref:NB-ARC domain-containing protein n=1 Tax=Nocardia amamiensis TaxID=404578 RepID=UPI001C3F6058
DLSSLLTSDNQLVALTALYGAGGFGKTTLAVQVCSLDEVKAVFTGGLLWATIGEERRGAELADIANDLSAQLADARPQFADPEQAGRYLGQLLDERGPTLLVVDDIWTVEQLTPFTFGGRHTTRLITTRNAGCLPVNAKTIRVDEMANEESQALVSRGLPPLPPRTVQQLLDMTGNWPLLLAMVNGAIRGYVRDGVLPSDASRMVAEQIQAGGPSILDVRIEERRDHAVRLTVAASLRRLPDAERTSYFKLGIFAEDTNIPLSLLALLWGLTDTETRQLCEDLADLSLVKAYRRGSLTLQLHDVIRDHLRHELAGQLQAVNREFLQAARTLLPAPESGWWQLPRTAEYLWRHLPYHLAAAGEYEALKALVLDLRWGSEKIQGFGLATYESDLVHIEGDPVVDALCRALVRKGHLLGPIDPPHSHPDLLISRLSQVPELRALVDEYSTTLPSNVARLTIRWPIPAADPSLLRVLAGHSAAVTGCAVSPEMEWLATASADRTVRLWDTSTWAERMVLTG